MPDHMRDIDPRRLVIRRQQHEAKRAEIERAMRVGVAEPTPPQWAKAVTIRAQLTGQRTARHAAYRIPPEHPAAHRLDQLHAGGHLDARLYANACAVMAIYHDSKLGKSEGVATWLRTCRTSGDGDMDRQTAEDVIRDMIEAGGVDFQAVLMVIRGDVVLPYMWARALRSLDKLDWLPARYDGERWRAE